MGPNQKALEELAESLARDPKLQDQPEVKKYIDLRLLYIQNQPRQGLDFPEFYYLKTTGLLRRTLHRLRNSLSKRRRHADN